MNTSSHNLPLVHERCLDTYFREINQYPLLSQEQEVKIAHLIREGDEDALHQLVTSNLRFVVSVAKQYVGRGLQLSDLINEGNLGMCTAANRFDVTRGYRFISYAVWWIRQAITQALMDKSRTIRLPQSQTVLLRRISKAREQLESEGNLNPTAEQLAEVMEEPVAKVSYVMQANQRPVPMDEHGEEGDDRPLSETLMAEDQPLPDHRLDTESLTIDIANMLTRLTEREAEVLRRYYGLGRENDQTLQEIGTHFGLTRERVRQIKEGALEKLRRLPQRDRVPVQRKVTM
jgi:RNA polymerase primary sigma factor